MHTSLTFEARHCHDHGHQHGASHHSACGWLRTLARCRSPTCRQCRRASCVAPTSRRQSFCGAAHDQQSHAIVPLFAAVAVGFVAVVVAAVVVEAVKAVCLVSCLSRSCLTAMMAAGLTAWAEERPHS